MTRLWDTPSPPLSTPSMDAVFSLAFPPPCVHRHRDHMAQGQSRPSSSGGREALPPHYDNSEILKKLCGGLLLGFFVFNFYEKLCFAFSQPLDSAPPFENPPVTPCCSEDRIQTLQSGLQGRPCMVWLLQYFFFFPHRACGILIPRPGIEPVSPETEVQSLF